MSIIVKIWRHLLFSVFATLLFVSSPVFSQRGDAPRSIIVDGRERSYLLYVPTTVDATKSTPLVLTFHGANGSGASIMGRFRAVADREGFLVCCPDGVNKRWNAGPAEEVRATGGADDVNFVSELIEEIARLHRLDRRRVYACGMSNGGALSHTLGVRLSDKLAAIAPVATTMPIMTAARLNQAGPMPVLQIVGSLDNVVRREGLLGLAETCLKWAEHNGCATTPDMTEWPDRDPDDGTRVIESVWKAPSNGADVRLLLIEGGLHSWPIGHAGGRPQPAGRQKASREFDAGEEIWKFFSANPKPMASVGQPSTDLTHPKAAASDRRERN